MTLTVRNFRHIHYPHTGHGSLQCANHVHRKLEPAADPSAGQARGRTGGPSVLQPDDSSSNPRCASAGRTAPTVTVRGQTKTVRRRQQAAYPAAASLPQDV